MDKELVVVIYGAKEENWKGGEGGGIHKAVLNQLHAIRELDWIPFLLTASLPCAEEASSYGYRVHYSEHWHNGVTPLLDRGCRKILRNLKRSDPYAILHHSGRTWVLERLVFKGIPNIQILHREKVRPYRFFRHWMALTVSYKNELSSQYTDKCISVVPNCYLSRSNGENTVSCDGGLKIGYAGRLGPGKGIDVLFNALQIIDNMDYKLYMCGDPVSGDLPDFMKQLYYNGVLIHKGWVERIEEFMKEIDVLVVPSRSESFGMVLLEAMSVGTPVIASSANGPKEIIENGKDGMIFDMNDSVELARCLKKIKSSKIRSVLGKNARSKYQEKFTPKAVSAILKNALEYHKEICTNKSK